VSIILFGLILCLVIGGIIAIWAGKMREDWLKFIEDRSKFRDEMWNQNKMRRGNEREETKE